MGEDLLTRSREEAPEAAQTPTGAAIGAPVMVPPARLFGPAGSLEDRLKARLLAAEAFEAGRGLQGIRRESNERLQLMAVTELFRLKLTRY